MTPERVQEFFEWLATAFLHGDMNWLDRIYVYPMSVFVDGEIRVETTSADTLHYLMQRRHLLSQAGVRMANVRIIELSPESTGRYKVGVDMILQDTRGTEIGCSRANYLCRNKSDRHIVIESVDIRTLGIPGTLHPPDQRPY